MVLTVLIAKQVQQNSDLSKEIWRPGQDQEPGMRNQAILGEQDKG